MADNTSKKVLILSVSAGNGHVRAAEALAAGLNRWFPGTGCRHVDLMTLVPALFRKAYKDAYLKLVQKHPALWGYIYARTDRQKAYSALSGLRRSIESACNKELMSILAGYAPDHILCTHFMPLQLLARWESKGRLRQPVWTCITDFVAHRYWLEPGQAGYFTANEEDAWRMRRRGMAGERIESPGIPVMPEFIPPANEAAARREAAARFGLDPHQRTFLLMGGGAGMGNLGETAKELLSSCTGFQLVVLAGRNQALLHALRQEERHYPGRLFPLGFTSEVPVLLSCSDMVITKPGGLTTVECLAMGKPMLILSPIPGQEEHNADYLLENGAALKAMDSTGLLRRIRRVLDEPDLLSRLANSAAVLGKPHAARDILAAVLNRAPQE